MKEFDYQNRAIKELREVALAILRGEKSSEWPVVLKAPTGSGKTYMLSRALREIVGECESPLAFVWLSVNRLHEQSMGALEKFFAAEGLFSCVLNTEISDNEIAENQIMFVNWHSLVRENNIFRDENERGWFLKNVCENTRDGDRKIVLIIDESHTNAQGDKAKAVIKEIEPALTIEISATPPNQRAEYVEVKMQDVIKEGMIKKRVYINPHAEKITEEKQLLKMALAKRERLQKFYQELGVNINPLLLIQLPRKGAGRTNSPEDDLRAQLATFGYTEQNGKVAVWLSDDKVNLETIEKADNPVKVLIFKEAIKQGWDCPRAAILFLQREWSAENYSFNMQTLGRIMRMPEQKHYDDYEELNCGFVYAVSKNIKIVGELADNYGVKFLLKRDDNGVYQPPIKKILSEHIRRKREIRRLTGDFHQFFNQAADETKLNEQINPNVSHLFGYIGTGGVVEEADKTQTIDFAEVKKIKLSESHVFGLYVDFLLSAIGNDFQKSRSIDILKTSLRQWFFATIDEKDENRIALLVIKHKNAVNEAIQLAKEFYKNQPTRDDKVEPETPIANWEPPLEIEIYRDANAISPSVRSLMKMDDELFHVPLRQNGTMELSAPEEEFIRKVEQSGDNLQWWFRNGVSEPKFFGIAYRGLDGKLMGFYPDFILRTRNEYIIVEIKSDTDFAPKNYRTLNAGNDYIERSRNINELKTRFFMLSPQDYENFFTAIKNDDFANFRSIYQADLLRKNATISKESEQKDESKLTTLEKENRELLAELEKAWQNEEMATERASLAEEMAAIARQNAERERQNREALEKAAFLKNETSVKNNTLSSFPIPFHFCILGDMGATEAQVQAELRKFFEKYGLGATDWDVEFFDNDKLKRQDVFAKLKAGRSKYHLAILGQFYLHNFKGNSSGDVYAELGKDGYIPHRKGSEPQKKLTIDNILSSLIDWLE